MTSIQSSSSSSQILDNANNSEATSASGSGANHRRRRNVDYRRKGSVRASDARRQPANEPAGESEPNHQHIGSSHSSSLPSDATQRNINNRRSQGGRPRFRGPVKLIHSQPSELPKTFPDQDNAFKDGSQRPRRNRHFMNNKLTNGSDENSNSSVATIRSQGNILDDDSLVSRLIRSLSGSPYSDCPICFLPIKPMQPIWSCSPSNSTDSDDQSATSQCCYTPFHLKCIKSWATKSVHDTREAFRARGETKPGEWRCPGCQKRRLIAPNACWCFCGSIQNPHTSRLATPHSCANACTRRRPCGHACPLQCHPGPCPPCQVVVQLKCFCKQKTKTFHCCELYTVDSTPKQPDLCCDRKCSKSLTCGRHFCQLLCHEGDCPLCDILERGKCYCGKVDRELKCGESDAKDCEIVNDVLTSRWIGRFDCGQRCNRLFDCGVHKCPQTCHVPSNSAPKCPLSPSVLTHCPCGKEFISQLDGGVRTSCVDAIPTCKQLCMKALGGCDHFCSAPCHTGDCPSCSVELPFPCRCGSTLRIIQCHERVRSQHDEVLCENRCSALRSCGRHQCNRVCCPLASLSSTSRGKKKSKVLPRSVVDDGGWHECDLTCGKLLSCGNHHCEQRDHQGLCPPCLRSTFTEIACRCGKTVLEPPIPCGIGIECSYPCSRPPPACGHPIVPHNCHEDTQTCPPCPFLTSKACACGKGIKNNVRCSQEKVSCGAKCDRLLDCGFHRCDRLCHGDDCGTCKQTCGKPPNHPCTSLCHAPASCPESDPCRSSVTLSCPCGRLQQASQCGRSAPNPAGRQGQQQLSCTKECQVAQRNARLAEALNISAGVRDREGIKPTVYKDELLQFAKRDPKFCDLVEKTFAEFIDSKKKSLVLPRTPESRRVFVRGLAAMYRMDTELLDAEPQRSVQIIRRIDTRVPHPLLSSAIESFKSRLGKLVDMGDLQSRNHKQSRPFLNSSATENTMQVKVDMTPGTWVVPQRRVTQVPSTVQNQPDVSTSSDTNLVPENWEDDNLLGDE